MIQIRWLIEKKNFTTKKSENNSSKLGFVTEERYQSNPGSEWISNSGGSPVEQRGIYERRAPPAWCGAVEDGMGRLRRGGLEECRSRRNSRRGGEGRERRPEQLDGPGRGDGVFGVYWTLFAVTRRVNGPF
jgi:hypothetical protein